jgi:hypothetical protein
VDKERAAKPDHSLTGDLSKPRLTGAGRDPIGWKRKIYNSTRSQSPVIAAGFVRRHE